MSLLRQVFGHSRDDDPTGANLIPPRSSGYGTYAGVPVTEIRALQQLTVWSCVSLLADTLSQLPVGLFKTQGDARVPLPDPPLLTQPFAAAEFQGFEWPAWLGAEMVSMLLRGNAYGLVVERDRLMYPTQIMPLHPDEISPAINSDGKLTWSIAGVGDTDPADVFHLPAMKLPGARWRWNVLGLSPIEYARQTIGLALGAEEFGARFFGDGAQPSGILTSDQKISRDEAKDMQERWEASHGDRRRFPAVTGGGLKWQTISIAPNESQFLETIDAKGYQIAGFYRVPPHMVGLVEKSTSWGTGIEEQNLGFITFTLGIWLIRWEKALSRLFPRGQYVKFNLAGLLRGRLIDRYKAYLMGRQGGWLTINDILGKEEMAPVEGGDDHLQPLNYAPIPSDAGPDATLGEPPRDQGENLTP